MEDKRITKRNLILFPLGTVGRDMMYNLVTSYLYTFVLFTRQLTAAQLSAIAGIMIAARVFDALNDPIMGNIIERTRGKWGKFKPWLLIGIVTTAFVIYGAFNTKLQGWPFVWFFGLIYFLYSITYTMHDISYWGMVPALSSDADTRNKFTSRATLFAGIGGMMAAAFIPMLTAATFSRMGSRGRTRRAARRRNASLRATDAPQERPHRRPQTKPNTWSRGSMHSSRSSGRRGSRALPL